MDIFFWGIMFNYNIIYIINGIWLLRMIQEYRVVEGLFGVYTRGVGRVSVCELMFFFVDRGSFEGFLFYFIIGVELVYSLRFFFN